MTKSIKVLLGKTEILFRIGQCKEDHHQMIDESSPQDLWFHLEDFPSSHIIASVPDDLNREKVKEIIRYGIRLSREKSKYGSDVAVVYRRIRDVKKSNVIGEVII
jgi:predicted ribosome quality control (RQC) complex YloA/Tae2 family protein